VDESLSELPDELRHPLILHFIEGESQENIASALEVNQSTISRRIDKGISLLRESLKRKGVAARC